MPNNVVYGILSDNKNNLWLSTNRGLSKFNTSKIIFKNYDVLDGLQSNEFNTGAYFNSKNGEMFFGGINGINYFFPGRIKDNPFPPPIVITGCKVLNDLTKDGREDKASFNSREIILPYNHNLIQINFAALDFSAPQNNKYAYKLESLNHDWIYSGRINSATFTNLSPGNYLFKVIGSNNDGIWNEKGTSIKLIILPPWWMNWWAYIIYGFLFLSILYMIRHYELNRLFFKNQLKLEKVESDSLRHIDQLKSQFFANISHEFRTPLTLILGQIDSIMSSGIAMKEKIKLQVANRNAKRLLILINQLLDLSKLEAGSMELIAQRHNIVSFLKSLFYSFESLAESQKITLKFFSQYASIPVEFDPDKMEKIFYNLLSNAFKFTPSNGEISVSINYRDSAFVEISIKDTGCGISSERLPFIFDRFYQVDGTGTREHEGSGIGLALAKELIELHKGKISVISSKESGTEFLIMVPAVGIANAQNQIVEDAKYENSLIKDFEAIVENTSVSDVEIIDDKDATNLKSEKGTSSREIVLVVEDNADVRAYICEQLRHDYIIQEAINGEVGLEKAQKVIPDLIITDIMMPKIDGYKFCNLIRENEKTSHIPIVILTAKAGLDDKIEGLEIGADDYLTKPFSAKELQVRVKNLIYQRKQLRKRFKQTTVIKPSEIDATSVDKLFIEKSIKIIETNIEDELFGVDQLADKVNMSVSQLNRKLNALINQPAGQLIRSLRLQRAADLLKKNAGSVAEICYKVGFNDQAYFSRAFKKQFGSSPSDFKKTSSS